MTLCEDCWLNFFIHENVDELGSLDITSKIIKKIGSVLELIREHGEKFLIEKTNKDYNFELIDYENRFKRLQDKFDVMQANDDVPKLLKFKEEALELLRELDLSHLMQCYRIHLAQVQIMSKDNEVSKLFSK